MRHVALSALLVCVLILAGCSGEAADSPAAASVSGGTYEGTITDVVLAERELEIAVPERDTFRAFFTDSTQVVQDSLEVGFGSLSAGGRIRVTVRPQGDALDMTRIEVVQAADGVLDP
ncbi:MAG: hypothetical protein GVY35_04515 [Bacteroidetes bacterium]|nr:hypothetical protein [Bacteroidota bacterium]